MTDGDASAPQQAEPPKLFGLLCTYRRRAELLTFLDLIEKQTRPPDVVVVVDNGSDASIRESIERRTKHGVDFVYLDPLSNIGPAGAFSAAFDHVLPICRPGDLVVHFDDDDPPVVDTALEHLVRDLEQLRLEDRRVGGIGLSGGRLDTKRGVVSRVSTTVDRDDVDHLHGGYLPIYAVEALMDVNGNDPTFFYGFEELELGRRLHLRGWRLIAHTGMMREVGHLYPKRGQQRNSWRVSHRQEPSWTRFHKERNLMRILRRERRWRAIAFTIVARHVAKPVWTMIRHPRLGARRIVLGIRATHAGLRERGGIDERYPPP